MPRSVDGKGHVLFHLTLHYLGNLPKPFELNPERIENPDPRSGTWLLYTEFRTSTFYPLG